MTLCISCSKKESWKMAREGLKTALSLAGVAVDFLPMLPGAKATITILSNIVDSIEMADANEETLKELTNRVTRIQTEICGRIRHHQPVVATSGLEGAFQKLNEDLKKHSDTLKAQHEMPCVIRLWKASLNAKALKASAVAIDRVLQEFVVRTVRSIEASIQDMAQEMRRLADNAELRNEEARLLAEQGRLLAEQNRLIAEQNRLAAEDSSINSLPHSIYASYKSARSDGPDVCFKDTRENVLQMLSHWANSLDDEPRLFWLYGQAGIGKSTIAHTFAKRLDEQKNLGASFVFQRSGHDSLKDAKIVFPTLAFQLAQFDPEIKSNIVEALHNKPDCHSGTPDVQFAELIIKPLCKLANQKRIIVVVLDALDECEPEDLSAKLISILVEYRHQFPCNLRILVTSRPEHFVRNTFEAPQNSTGIRLLDLHRYDNTAGVVGGEIESFLKTRLTEAWNIFNNSTQMDQWPTQEILEKLVAETGHLFIYAATVVRFIEHDRVGSPQAQLDIILNFISQSTSINSSKIEGVDNNLAGNELPDTIDDRPFAKLDQLYLQIIQKALPSDCLSRYSITRFKLIVGSIVILRVPLSLTALSQLLNRTYNEDEIRTALDHLHSVIIVPKSNDEPALRAYHLSFSNFITSRTRCTNKAGYIDPDNHELDLFGRCISVIGTSLETEDHTEPTTELPDLLLKEYCYSQWANHLRNVTPGDSTRDTLILNLFAQFQDSHSDWSSFVTDTTTYQLLTKAASYHWRRDSNEFKQLSHGNAEKQNNLINLEFYELRPDDEGDWRPIGKNLCINNKIAFTLSETSFYGFKLSNSASNPDLYPFIYLFDNYGFNIFNLYAPTSSLPPLTAGGICTIGYGSASMENHGSPSWFALEKDQTSDLSLIRIVLSTEQVDMTEIMNSWQRRPLPLCWGIVDIPFTVIRAIGLT